MYIGQPLMNGLIGNVPSLLLQAGHDGQRDGRIVALVFTMQPQLELLPCFLLLTDFYQAIKGFLVAIRITGKKVLLDIPER